MQIGSVVVSCFVWTFSFHCLLPKVYEVSSWIFGWIFTLDLLEFWRLRLLWLYCGAWRGLDTTWRLWRSDEAQTAFLVFHCVILAGVPARGISCGSLVHSILESFVATLNNREFLALPSPFAFASFWRLIMRSSLVHRASRQQPATPFIFSPDPSPANQPTCTT